MPSTLDLIRRKPLLLKKLVSDHAAPQRKSASQPQALQQATIQRALANPAALTPAEVPQLQRLMGNGAVSDLLGRARAGQEGTGSLRVGASNDAHEREARQVATSVGGAHTVQRSSGSTGEVTEEPTIGSEGGVINREVENTIQSASSGGKAVPDEVRMKVERETGHSFEGVKVHQGAHADQANRAMGARAFTQGKHIYLGQNQSPHDVQLMAHELTHTVQQGATGPANGGVADIQRDDEEDRKKIKKLNKKISGTKAKKGFAKVGKGLLTAVDWLVTAPARLIDHASVLDLHLKDFGNFVSSGGKTRKERAGANSSSMKYHEGTKRRRAGRTGVRALLSGVNIHNRSAQPYIPGVHSMFNPFLALGTGQATAKKLGKGYDKDLNKMRGQKQNLRDRLNQNEQQLPLGNEVDGEVDEVKSGGEQMDEETLSQVMEMVDEEEDKEN